MRRRIGCCAGALKVRSAAAAFGWRWERGHTLAEGRLAVRARRGRPSRHLPGPLPHTETRAGGYSERGVARRGALRPAPSNRTASVAPAPAPSLPRNCPADAADADKISRAARGTAKRSACRGCYGYGLILKVR